MARHSIFVTSRELTASPQQQQEESYPFFADQYHPWAGEDLNSATLPAAALRYQNDPYSQVSSCRLVYVAAGAARSPSRHGGSNSSSHPVSPVSVSPLNGSVAGHLDHDPLPYYYGAGVAAMGPPMMYHHDDAVKPTPRIAPFLSMLAVPPKVGTLHLALRGNGLEEAPATVVVPFVPYPSVAATGCLPAQSMASPLTPPSAFGDRAVTNQYCETDFDAALLPPLPEHHNDDEKEDGIEFVSAAEEAERLAARKRAGCRLFLGQLPLYVTAQQVQWIVETVTGCTVFGTEAIHSWGSGGQTGSTGKSSAATNGRGKKGKVRSPTTTTAQQPKGCVHTYCDTDADAEWIVQRLGQESRVLVDDTGIFVATSEAEKNRLFEYCAEMAADVQKRFPMRPFRPVVAQRATSTFVPVVPAEGQQQPSSRSPPQSVGLAASANAMSAAVQAPPPYYSCAVERLRQEATLPPLTMMMAPPASATSCSTSWDGQYVTATTTVLPSYRRRL